MIWLSFVYPRSHSGWIGPIGEFAGAAFKRKPAYRYSILLSFDLNSIWRNRLAFLMPFRTSTMAWLDFCMFWLSRIGWLVFSMFDWVLCTAGLIPAELDRLVNLQHLNLLDNKHPGTPSLSSLTCIQYEGKGLLSLCPFIPVGWGDLFFVCFDWVLCQNIGATG